MTTQPWQLIIFDKDGTLVDHNTWDVVTGRLIDRLATNDAERSAAADALEYDLDRQSFRPGAVLLAESNEKWIARLAPCVAGGGEPSFGALVESVTAELIATHVAPLPGATRILERLARHQVPLAMATNDSEASAVEQVAELGWSELFTAVVGYDSGHGPKPEPGMLVALVDRFDTDPAHTLMVGDTWADAQSAAAAGVPFCLLDPTGANESRLRADLIVRSLEELEFHLLGEDG